MWMLCVLLKISEVWCCCCWILDEFMINWCWCWYKMLLLMIHAMSIHDYGICGEIWIVFESFMKNGWIGDLWWNDVFDSSFVWFWVSFYVYKRLDKLWKQIWVLGNQNWGFGVKMEIFPKSRIFENCHNSPWRVAKYTNSYFVVFRVLGRSKPFQTDSFDVIKCNQTFKTSVNIKWIDLNLVWRIMPQTYEKQEERWFFRKDRTRVL